MKIKKYILVSVTAIAAAIVLLPAVASAQSLSDQVPPLTEEPTQANPSSSPEQVAAENFCGKGNGGEETACRKGFRTGYTGAGTLEATCTNRSEYGPLQKASCKKGYEAAQTQAGLHTQAGANDPLAKYGGKYPCGKKDPAGKGSVVLTKFNIGCLGTKYTGNSLSPIEDMAYALLRFLSAGVGVVLVIAIIWSGIQYSASEGNPEATQAAKGRIQAVFMGLIFYLFSFALVQYLVPGGVFNSAGISSETNIAMIQLTKDRA